ncbi:hypothetical protein [Tenacibaculum sp. nBUS_03]|uniref:hypothetical protein n=1 Tax=Tenacibaculum sp. nBUS_03 TaxID=3395320 RepID=UPI003EBED562
MKSFLTIIKLDYLQRTRSYTFLITLCASLAIAYTFIPEPNANYSTIRIANYIGTYNTAWFGYVTAIMSSLFLSLIGFYLVNNSIKTDLNTKVGQIIASTKIENFNYLFSKALSNFLVLLAILCTIFIMSSILFLFYNDGFPFEILHFVKPYFIITIPALFFISCIAVIFEVFLGKYSVLQNIGFFFLFSLLMLSNKKNQNNFSLDVLGTEIVMHHMENQVRKITNAKKTKELSIGYVLGNVKKAKKFQFDGITFPTTFILSRLAWVLFSIGAIGMTSLFFHRFNIEEKKSGKKTKIKPQQKASHKNINLLNLPTIKTNFSIFPLLRTEFLLLIRRGKKWLWLINCAGMILLLVTPLQIAHQFILPTLWFLQVGRLSDVSTKEVENDIYFFSFSSYKPISRLLFSQILASILLLLLLAAPLYMRLIVNGNFIDFNSIILGGTFIALVAVFLGIITKGKKLFEILFFIITYANLNKIPFFDYFGALTHNYIHINKLIINIALLTIFSFLIRKKIMSNL